MYAKWDINRYIVTFNADGGTPAPVQQIRDHGSKVMNLTAMTRTDYTFGGWFKEPAFINQWNFATDTVTADTVLYAKWTLNQYTVTFNINSGSGTVPSAQTVATGSSITLPSGNGLSRTSYDFGGWNTKTDGTGTNYNASSSYQVTGTVTLYAKWNPISCTITFNINRGSGPRFNVLTFAAGSSITLPSGDGLTRTGYTFGGWNTNSSGTGTNYNASSSYTVTGTTTLYAKWDANTVTFNTNGGSSISDQTITNEAAATRPVNPTRNSYVFDYWYTDMECTVPYNFTTGVTSSITLHTKWILQADITAMAAKDMVFVPGGSYQMGKNLGSGGGSDVTPVHTVTLTGFYIGKYEVTQSQYQAVMGTNPSHSDGEGDNYPVYFVSWYDALVFCNKLSTNEGLTPAYRINNSTDPTAWGSVPTISNSRWDAVTIVSGSTGYRLPMEAQWEYAAKGGDPTATGWVGYTYAGSDNPDEVAWYNSSGDSTTKVVGTKAPNRLGIYDMSGNVREWCWDWYGSYSIGAQTDPQGASSGSYRVNRGGRWDFSAGNVRSAIRGNESSPYYRYGQMGFRLDRPAQ